jgi:alpha-D-xyloside xylohydrolase
VAALLNQPIDVSADFADPNHTYFLPENLARFEIETGAGALRWKGNRLDAGLYFDHKIESYREVPGSEYPQLPFAIEFISANTIRVRLQSSATARKRPPSLMLVDEGRGGQLPADGSWKREKVADGHLFSSAAGSVLLREKPWTLEIRDASGKVLTQTVGDSYFQAFSFVRRQNDYSRCFSAVFSLAPNEKLFGCGESYTALNKRGQRFLLSTTDPLSSEKPQMYKPVPFFLSSAGYGIFVHTSAPTTFDLGATHSGRSTITTGDDELDLFIFLGTPKEIIGAYTSLTGRASMPPLWSFGLWMSRITYDSETQARDVAAKARANRIPCDVISTWDLDWTQIELALFSSESTSATGLICLPSDQKLHAISVDRSGGTVKDDPYAGKVAWKVESK